MGNSILLEATIRSLAISGMTAFIAGALGISMAWLVSRTALPGRNSIGSLLSVPYALPPYLLGIAWVVLGNPQVGLLKDFLPEGGSYGYWGITLVLASCAFAFPYLELKAGFDRMDSSLEEAARISGAGPWRVFRDVSFPLLWPALINGMCLSFIYALAAFGVPALLGAPVNQFVLTTLIYSEFRMGSADGLWRGLELSGILLVIALSVLAISWKLTAYQNKRSAAIVGSKTARPSLVELGAWQVPAATLCWALLLVSVALPWVALGLSALAPVAGKYSPALWTLAHLKEVFFLPEFREGLLNSAILAAGVASLIVAFGFILAFLSARRKSKTASAIIESLGIPFATPGTVIAIALIFTTAALGRIGVNVDFPLFIMGVAYALKYGAVGAKSLVVAFRQVDASLEEAARISGARTVTLLRTIWAPLLKQSLGAAWVLAALPMLTELNMSVLLTGPGAHTLGTVLFDLQNYRDQPSAAALAWILLTLALAVGLWTRRTAR